MKFSYKTKGTCSYQINFSINNDIVNDVEFIGGCNGNTKGIAALVEGMKVDEVISRLSGIKCGMKATSCPDQLSHALQKAKSEMGD
ncbi:MAG: TIGR03905 family TSCPD domain-containing protein [Clostridia bacterium]|nr:TIGR03905 family TSCPD domain-containing protein [Clostridia bacterium]